MAFSYTWGLDSNSCVSSVLKCCQNYIGKELHLHLSLGCPRLDAYFVLLSFKHSVCTVSDALLEQHQHFATDPQLSQGRVRVRVRVGSGSGQGQGQGQVRVRVGVGSGSQGATNATSICWHFGRLC